MSASAVMTIRGGKSAPIANPSKTMTPGTHDCFHWDELEGHPTEVRHPIGPKLWLLVLLCLLYCVSAFWRTLPTEATQPDPLADFLRRYLSQTGGYRHVFYRFRGSEADWAVYSRPEKVIQSDAAFTYGLIGHGKRLTVYRWPENTDASSLKPAELMNQGQELEFHDFKAPISVEEESNSRFFSYVEEKKIKYSRWLSFREGTVPCGEVSLSLTQPRYHFGFNQQHSDAHVTNDGSQQISLEDLQSHKPVILLWICQKVYLSQKVSLSLADCRDGMVAVQPPKKLWFLIAVARLKTFLSDAWAILALSLMMTGLGLLAAEQLLAAPILTQHPINYGLRRTPRFKKGAERVG